MDLDYNTLKFASELLFHMLLIVSGLYYPILLIGFLIGSIRPLPFYKFTKYRIRYTKPSDSQIGIYKIQSCQGLVIPWIYEDLKDYEMRFETSSLRSSQTSYENKFYHEYMAQEFIKNKRIDNEWIYYRELQEYKEKEEIKKNDKFIKEKIWVPKARPIKEAKKLEIDTLILVSNDKKEWYLRYFIRVENNKIICTADGQTSAKIKSEVSWNYWQPEESNE